MKIPSRHEADLIKTVQAHIKNLTSLSGYKADEPTIRIATGTLRALLFRRYVTALLASSRASRAYYVQDVRHRKWG